MKNGDLSTPFKCNGGNSWTYPKCETDNPPTCVPRCSVPCRHGGVCVAPDTCSCLPHFVGQHCGQKAQLPCIKPPPAIPNAAIQIRYCQRKFKYESVDFYFFNNNCCHFYTRNCIYVTAIVLCLSTAHRIQLFHLKKL